ncbi:glycosyltransferase family 9 protein [Thermoactinospora rubra]|uniref:glycosyltransferase family 9 protein n=1 Tax=Thermoactinospora rubra TaxID=1088767 RepID=UPI001F0B305F|nr:glycosyltransferase family 9 protein [Thermoactinospora rubra]
MPSGAVPDALPDVRSIAVLRANAIGDFLLALPALEALRAAYPAARITLLGLAWHRDFLTGRPGPVDEVVALPPDPLAAPPGERLRARRFDLAVQLHGGGRESNPFVRKLGARVTAGLCTPDAERLDRWLPYLPYHHETLRYLEVAALVGARTAGLEPRVRVTAADRAEAYRVVGEVPRGAVAVHPGASDPRRRWPPERFAAVADALGRPVVVTGSEAERELVLRTCEAMRAPAIPVAGTLGLGGLAALYQRCDLLVGNDTGPRHLAAAVGTPTVSVYWMVNLINHGPISRARHRPLVSWTPACPVCGAGSLEPAAERCPHDVPWVTDVPVESVLEQAVQLLEAS